MKKDFLRVSVSPWLISNQKGMTILEMMIAVTILVIIMGATITFLIFSNRQYSWIDTQGRIQKELRGAIQEMSIDIKESRLICDGSTANKLILSLPIWIPMVQ